MSNPSARPAGDAQVAWRYWCLQSAPYRLHAISQPRVVWLPRTPLRAICLADSHPAPDPGCACGVYGSRDLASLQSHALCLRPGPLVVGEVGLWGPIVADGDGFRAAWGYPRRMWLVDDTVAEPRRAAALAELADYGVAVGTIPMAEAVGQASATIMEFLAMSGPQPPPESA